MVRFASPVALLIVLVIVLPTRAEEAPPAAQPFDPAHVEFFEENIRPVLVKECYGCHSATAEKLQGGLYLDSRAGLLDGGDSGPAVVVGQPGASLLIEALKHESFEMPPDKTLPAAVVADFERWIVDGLADPRERPEGAARKRRVLYAEADAESHWAFQPVVEPPVPDLDDPWIRTPIDAFVLARLRAAGLEPSPPADRRTLLRRASYDLTGLPPSVEEVRAFAATEATRPFAEVVDELLASPRYGEKWGRHWLDVARYADTNGERPAPTPDPPFFPFAWVYRDYVIDALNRDVPFDRFVVEQLAGDALVTEDDPRSLAGLGFLRVGKTFGQGLDDRIDDRIDTASKAFLGLTVACARCHDHKLDPVFQDDYYALHGVLASSEDVDVTFRDTRGTPAHAEYLQERQALETEIEAECIDGINEFLHGLTEQVAVHLVATERYRDGELSETVPALAAREVDLQPIPFEAALAAVTRWEKQETPAYRPWFAFAALGKDEFAARGPALAGEIAGGSLGGKPIPALVAERFAKQRPQKLEEVAAIYQALYLDVERLADGQYPMAHLLCGLQESPGTFRKEYLKHPALPPALDDAELESLRRSTIGFDGLFFMSPRETMQCGAAESRKAMVRRLHEIDELEATHPGAPVLAMAVRDLAEPVDSPLYIRGDSGSHGPIVPRRFLRRLSDGPPRPFTEGSGRLELARAIASPENPLTARVIVNRVWQWHFGRGLVTTPGDFGLNGAPPTHPELLDWLAARFVADGWSLKRLHRLIMDSSVYRQSSRPRPEGLEADAANELLWRTSPRRMTFEEIRDTWLTAAGTLEHRSGGRPVDPANATARSVYLLVDRYDLPDLFTTFDFATPEFTTAERETTTVPQQALFVMNAEWLLARAGELAARPEVASADTPAARIRALYEIVHQRPPDDTELSLGTAYLRGFPADETATGLERLAHALLQTNEAIFVP
jgi:hypothetical protein